MARDGGDDDEVKLWILPCVSARDVVCYCSAPPHYSMNLSCSLIRYSTPTQSLTMATLKRKAPEFVDAPDATPTGRPVKKLRLTQSQKQALIDNLQLESTSEGGDLKYKLVLTNPQSLSALASFVHNMLFRQMTFDPVLNDASTVFPSLFARPTWASFLRSTRPRLRRLRPFVESLQQRSRVLPCPLAKHFHPPARATAGPDATGRITAVSPQSSPNTDMFAQQRGPLL